MKTMDLEKLKFPIGEYVKPEKIDQKSIDTWMRPIADFPSQIRDLTVGLDEVRLNWRYRPEGWKIKQLVHHCADSHSNALIRFKWSLTEDTPQIKAYFEDRWAELSDSQDNDLSSSLAIISGVHAKWSYLMSQMTSAQFDLGYLHPEHGRLFTLGEAVAMYAWHCEHHLAHIRLGLSSVGRYM